MSSVSSLGGCRLERVLSRSEHSDLYRAFSEELQRPVMIKVLSGRYPATSRMARRFLRGGKLAAELEHQNIVRTFSAGVERERPYMLMEYLEGHSLDRILEVKKRIPWELATGIIRQAAKALDAASRMNVVHRKIEPSHIMLSPGGRAKVLGFGLARLSEAQPAAQGITASGALVNIGPYSPPECGEGVQDIRGDLYSLGCVYYHLLCGRPPFESRECLELLHLHRTEPAWDVRDLVPTLSEPIALLVHQLLMKELVDRVQTPKDLIALIDAAVNPEILGAQGIKPDSTIVSTTMSMLAVREKMNVLVCDSREYVISTLKETLRCMGVSCLTTRDGRAAVDAIQSRDVKLVITDLKVPRLARENLLQAITLAKRDLPIIISRGGELARSIEKSGQYNIQSCLERPLDLFELRKQVKKALPQ